MTAVTANFFLDFFSQAFAYREYLSQSVIRDLKTKYKRSILGYFWTMLHPLAMMSILAIVFSNIMRMDTQDYAIFLFAGLLPWNYFNSTAMMSLGSIRANSRLFSQVPVPKYIFVLSIASSNLVNLLLSLIPLLVLSLVLGHAISPVMIAFPIVLLPITLVTVGISLILATSAVFYDDTLHLAEVALQALYFLCPILYHRGHLPSGLVSYLSWNPLFQQIEFFRGVFYDGVLPDPFLYGCNLVTSLGVLAIGLTIFQKNHHKFLYFV